MYFVLLFIHVLLLPYYDIYVLCYLVLMIHQMNSSLKSVAQSDAHPTEDQEVVGLIPAGSSNIL